MDLKFAIRSLRKTPGLTAVAVLVLALGIGANSAVFSVVNAVLLKPLDYNQPDRIVTLWTAWKNHGGAIGQVSAPDFHDWRDQSRAFSAMADYSADEDPVMVKHRALYVHDAAVSPGFFRALGAHAAIGRLFAAGDERTGAPLVAAISHAFWMHEFAGNPSALGQTIAAGGRAFTIAGVLPPGFDFPDHTEVWYPSWIYAETPSRTAQNYRVVAWLKPGVSVTQAQQQMDVIAGRLARRYPLDDADKGIAVIPLKELMVRHVKATLYLLLGSVGLVLLIACANVANLLLAKATSRTREMAVRAAVGASRWRIVRQLITESLVLGVVAGAAGIGLGVWCVKALVALAPANIPRLAEVRLDGSVMAFTAGVALVASLLFGLAPALTSARVDLAEALKQGARNAGLAGGGRLRTVLVVGEVAVSVVLACGAGLLLRSFVALDNVDWGVRISHLLVAEADVAAADLAGARRATAFYGELLPRLAGIPGVTSVAATAGLPDNPRSNGNYFVIGGRMPQQTGVSRPQAAFEVVTPGYFRAMGIALIAGRDFSERDGYDAPRVAIVNQALAKRAFPNRNPIGRQIYCGMDLESTKPMTIVGVVSDVRQYGAGMPAPDEIIMPYRQHPEVAAAMNIVARTTADPRALDETFRKEIRAVNPDVPVKFTTLDAEISNSMASPRFRAILLGLFAGLAVALAMAGVYGVMAYSVSSRSAEIGVRMAMGARPGDVLRMVLAQGLKLGAVGVVLGVGGALAASRLLTSMLFYVKPGDPATYLEVALVLGAVTVLAGCVPALRAARIDPVKALREE
jgi:putative ABC transport system permease protein